MPRFAQRNGRGVLVRSPYLRGGIFCGMFIGLFCSVFSLRCRLAVDEGGRFYARGDDAADVSARTEGMRWLYFNGHDCQPVSHF
jgi:hypothetical protein